MKNFGALIATGILLVSSLPGGSCCSVWQRKTSSGSCKNCDYGQVAVNNICTACKPGFVRGNRDGSTLSDCKTAVGICDPHERAIDGKCSSCSNGKVSLNKIDCVNCSPGLVRGGEKDGSGHGDCVDADKICDSNQKARRGACRACASGEVSPRPATSRCTTCPSGTEPKYDYNKCFFDVSSQAFAAPQLINSTTLDSWQPKKLTVSVRMNPTKIPSATTYLVAKGTFNACGWASYAMYFENSLLKFYIGDATKYYETPGTTITTNQWNQIVGTFNGTHVNLYVNGKPINSAAAATSIKYDTDPLTIGYYGSCDGKPFGLLADSTLSELCFWDKALDATAVKKLYNQCR